MLSPQRNLVVDILNTWVGYCSVRMCRSSGVSLSALLSPGHWWSFSAWWAPWHSTSGVRQRWRWFPPSSTSSTLIHATVSHAPVLSPLCVHPRPGPHHLLMDSGCFRLTPRHSAALNTCSSVCLTWLHFSSLPVVGFVFIFQHSQNSVYTGMLYIVAYLKLLKCILNKFLMSIKYLSIVMF